MGISVPWIARAAAVVAGVVGGGARVIGQTLPPGQWTVIVHGYEASSTAFDDLTSSSGWMFRLASAVAALDPGNVDIYKLNQADFGITALAGSLPPLPTRHHVVLFDWVANSSTLSNGWAYAAGESMYAFLKRWGAGASVQCLIGHSRGSIVISEATRHLILEGNHPRQVIYLDGEGETQVFSDDRFDAWQPPASTTIQFDNIFETYSEPVTCTVIPLGGHPRPKCHDLSLGTAYAHAAPVFPGGCFGRNPIYDYLISGPGLHFSAGLFGYPSTPAAVQDVTPMDPAAFPAPALFNGDLQYGTLAGWLGHGGSGTGTVATFSGSSTLRLARGQFQTHSYFWLAPCTGTLQFAAAIDTGSVGDSALSIQVQKDGDSPIELGPVPLSRFSGTLLVRTPQMPSSIWGSVCRVTFRVQGTMGTAVCFLDNIAAGPTGADADHNGRVEPADVAVFVNTWFTSLTQGTLAGDFDGDGAVSPSDVGVFINTWFTALTSGC